MTQAARPPYSATWAGASLRALETVARCPHIHELLSVWVRELASSANGERIGLFLPEGDGWLSFLPPEASTPDAVVPESTLDDALEMAEPTLVGSGPEAVLLCRFAGRESWRGIAALWSVGGEITANDAPRLRELAVEIGRSITALRRAEAVQHQAVALERERLAAEIHDGLLQTVFSARMQAEICLRQDEELSAKLAADLQRTHEMLGSALVEARRFLLELKLPSGDTEQFVPWLQEYAEDFTREYGIETTVEVRGEGGLTLLHAQAATRVVREALRNVRKHSRARSVRIDVAFLRESVAISIADDGVGFELRPILEKSLESSHHGLAGMQYRVESTGGEMRLASRPGCGTIVTFRFPKKLPLGAGNGLEPRRRPDPLPCADGNPLPGASARPGLATLQTLFDETLPLGHRTKPQ
jgi:signal transduction histidine kinase